ncbi:glycerol-3-phosphate 1-O-acyltransferase PlsY [Nitrospirillum sp. BR 11828]|uniref:glycerol-3-phosphate 1-O-acyltransferase PlsY n=1 Tax=Nitrospirillum sp. BR 11828 TaxID=3104325 RepID=UPI002ACAF173|nr:glycerol-3-phosphate 1-O-acyltransferase PlsY [Nitrospirillum sp. BR 11828]MDZ5648466.1 glycerol-3-phosphate 1-O-acyltransferase PlsY [Nitrospirillum sp. BR 11828]
MPMDTAALPLIPLLLALAGGYLLGSIPFGLVLAYLGGYGDIRKIGSGNIGATNVLRTGNKPLAAATLVLDSGKGAIAVAIAHCLAMSALPSPDAPHLAALVAGGGAMLGHTFPVWLGFKGGKGVATALGVLLATSWPVGVIACLTWLLVAVLFRISSLSALVALALAPLVAWLLPAVCPAATGFGAGGAEATLALAIAVLVWIRHHANIRRLLSGTEPRIGQGKKAAADTGT